MDNDVAIAEKGTAPIPRTFLDYVRSFGPGIVVVLTWLGAGDIVDASVAGGHYGYALMWVLAGALCIRWLFVSAIARYDLCNPRGEAVLDGMGRLHRGLPWFVLIATVLLSHIIGAYLYQGLGETLREVFGFGEPWHWGVAWAALSYALIRRPAMRSIEAVFLVFLAMLSISLIGTALWVGPDWGAALLGTIGFRLPESRGQFDPVLIATSLIGAVVGSLANLMYPYLIREKGWRGPQYLKVQRYDLAFGVLMIIILDLAVWVLGAEVLHPRGIEVHSVKELGSLLGDVLGPIGRLMLYAGVFAAIASTIVGNAFSYSLIVADARRVVKGETLDPTQPLRGTPTYAWMVLWCLVSPLPWVMIGKTGFIALTILVNSFQVLMLPILGITLWVMTSRMDFIGKEHRNGPLQHLGLALFNAAALLGAYKAAESLILSFQGG